MNREEHIHNSGDAADENGKRPPVLLVWITNPLAAGRIAVAGRRVADDNGFDMMVVSIRNSIKDNWADTVTDLEKLHAAAEDADAELTVVYSDDRLASAAKLIRDVAPVAMFAGIPGNTDKNLFLEHIRDYNKDIPIYTVDPSGVVALLK